MAERKKISRNEKKILNAIGRNANLSNGEIIPFTDYKRENTISKKIEKLREMDIIRGPYWDLNLSAVGKNQIYNIYADIVFAPEDRDLIYEILKIISGMTWIFPIQQEDRFFTHFQCNHYSVIGKLLRIMEKKKLITYRMAATRNRWIKMNPDFFGPPIPDMRTLFNTCSLPDLSYSRTESSVKWNKIDLTIMQYLQVETDKSSKIREIEYRRYGHFWTSDQITTSIRKIEGSGIIQSKEYHISPYPRNKCCTFILLLDVPKRKMLQRVLHNFGKWCRIYKTYTVARDTGFLFCWAATEIVPELIALFDTVNDVTVRGVYYLRTHTGKYLYGSSLDPDLFNIKSQKWEFPYAKVKKQIEELITERVVRNSNGDLTFL